MCKNLIPEEVNWIVMETAFCRFIMCETCCDANTYPIEEDEDADIDMNELENALLEVENAMQEDSESSVSTDASQEE
jgi:hypothetical protein